MSEIQYRIRKKVGDEYRWSTGGNSPYWVEEKKAKTWRTIGQLKTHPAQFVSYKGLNGVPADWEVIEVEVKPTYGTVRNAREMAEVGAEKKRKRNHWG